MNNLSIEKFAAFLDGNLPEDEMQAVASLIDANEDYSAMLDDVMTIDDSLDMLSDQDDLVPAELLEMDFDLPEIAVSDADSVSLFMMPEDGGDDVHCLDVADDAPVSVGVVADEQDVVDAHPVTMDEQDVVGACPVAMADATESGEDATLVCYENPVEDQLPEDIGGE